jgi:hypothetical protein
MKKKVLLFCGVSLLTFASLISFANEFIYWIGDNTSEKCTSTIPCEDDPRGIPYSTHKDLTTGDLTCCCAYETGVRGCKKL